MVDKPTLTLNKHTINTTIFEAAESDNGYTLTYTSRVIRTRGMGREDHVACIGKIISVNCGN
jgi:hypothetical protein